MSEKFTEEGTDNTNAVSNIVETGDLHEVSMILGSRERIRHAGVIRPGIKIPLSGCSDQQKAVYSRMLDDGCGFSEIDVEMLKVAPKGYSKKTCLRPSNSDYFTIRDEDFKRSADAEYIRTHYADPDGKVRRIPCWLPLSDIEKVVPHNFRAFSAGGLRCVSFYDDLDGRLKFKFLPRDFKGSPRPEDWRVLDSDDEKEATKACGIDVKFGGIYRVYVPGTRGAGEIICPTQSWYGLGESVAVLRRVRSILGRFDGLFNGNAFFELCKVAETVKTPEGKKQQQWIVTLELAVDPMELARYAEPGAVAARSSQALSLLTGRLPEPVPDLDPIPVPEAPADAVPAPDASKASAAPPPPPGDYDSSAAIGALVSLVTPHGISRKQIEIYAASQGMGQAMEEMSKAEMSELYRNVRSGLRDDLDAFVAMIKEIAGGEA